MPAPAGRSPIVASPRSPDDTPTEATTSEVEPYQAVDEPDDRVEEGGQQARREDQQCEEDEDPVLVEEVDDPLAPLWQHDRQQPRAVQWRDRHEIEDAQHDVEVDQCLQQDQRELRGPTAEQQQPQDQGA